MGAPIRGRDLILDERVDRFRVGYAKKRLGKTHQSDALVGREAVFGKEHVHHTRPRGAANALDEPGAAFNDLGSGARIEIRHRR